MNYSLLFLTFDTKFRVARNHYNDVKSAHTNTQIKTMNSDLSILLQYDDPQRYKIMNKAKCVGMFSRTRLSL
jgi:hypothetical protein